MKLGTLQKIVTAMGASLSIVARFPDGSNWVSLTATVAQCRFGFSGGKIEQTPNFPLMLANR